jgi:hypothetical protein
MKYYREAVLAPDVDDTSALWLGNELHNQQRHHDAAEAYAYGCLLDPVDAANFSHLAEELSICINERARPVGRNDNDQNPVDQIEPNVILELAHCASSCPNMDAEMSDSLRRALQRLDINSDDFDSPLTRSERVQCVKQLYETLCTDLTTPGKPYDFSAQQVDAVDGE